MDYFRNSQERRKEILQDQAILGAVREAFDGALKPFGHGSTTNLYRLGRMPSGLHVALRVFRPESHFGRCAFPVQAVGMEHYCQNAEDLAAEKKDVPAYCVGVAYSGKAGIILEDLTANGTHPITLESGSVCGMVNGRRVYIDIDCEFNERSPIHARYFQLRNVIRLRRDKVLV